MEKKIINQLKMLACKVRIGIIEGIYSAQSGHPGGSLSIADTLVYLYSNILNIDANKPDAFDRDRFILSKGHTAPALYAILALKDFFNYSELFTLRKINSKLQGHPDMNKTPGIDMSTGSLGQGFSAACGIALSGKISGQKYKVYSILGDGEIQEGQVWEAAMFANHNNLNNLIAIIDYNGLQIDGKVKDICDLGDIKLKFKSFGWSVYDMDAHNFESMENTFQTILNNNTNKPTAIVQTSVKGKGISFMEDICSWHGIAPNKSQYIDAIHQLEHELDKLEEELLCLC